MIYELMSEKLKLRVELHTMQLENYTYMCTHAARFKITRATIHIRDL